jgi:acetyltransferase-like isoleucine patch superfamily enzyme
MGRAIASDAVIGAGTRFEGPGEVTIGAGARLGERCVILCHERIEVGAGAVLGDDVVLVDFAHDFSDPETPTRHQPLLTAPIVVGAGAVVGHRAVLERGSNIPPGGTVPPGQRPRMGA